MSNTDAWYDAESVNRFIRATLSSEDPQAVSKEDQRAAAWALLAALQGRNICKDMGLSKNPGERGPKIPPDGLTIDSDAMGIVMRWRSGGIKYKDALNEIMDATGLGMATAKKLMKDLRPRAEDTIKVFDQWHAEATGTTPPKRKF